MSFELWIAFAVASAALVAIPGPTVMLVVSYALGRGRASGWATVPGVVLGDFTAMTVSLLGAGAILAASATLFSILKCFGAAYLIWRGVLLWRSKVSSGGLGETGLGQTASSTAGRRMFWNAYVVTALNPKSIVFFVAFVPQFVDATHPMLAQFAILEATFLALAAVNVTLWATLVGEMRSRFARPSTLRLLNRVGGRFLVGAGILTAVSRPTS